MAPATTCIAILTLSLGLNTSADDWPHVRGPAMDGRTAGAELPAGEIDLRAVWTVPVGPAYSCMAIADGRAVTLYSSGEVDNVVALDADDGSELWRYRLGPTYLGHDGSEDGPVSSPLIGQGQVFVVGPRGQLLALAAATGELVWSTHLVEDWGATAPEYGFTTTPILEQGTLIVQVGGSDGRAVCGFNAATGDLRWSVGEGEAAYQSPLAMDLAGRRQVVVLNGNEILGVAPQSGERLWTLPLGGRDSASSGLATAVDGSRFFAKVSGALAMFAVDPDGSGFRVEELFRSRELSGSYAAAVHHDGYLYGYRSDFLTCIDAATGKRMWKSRPPGGKGLIGVGERLLVFGADGVLAVVRATPEEYREEARLRVLEHSSFSWPSFANGRVFVRNSKQLTCVEIVPRTDARPIAAASEKVQSGAFARFVRSLETADDKQASIDAFFEENQRFPILEGNLVHIVFRGDVQDVAVAGSMVSGSTSEALARVEGTDFYHRTYEIEPGARWEYRFQLDFDEWRADPLNPHSSPAAWGDTPVSEVITSGYEPATHHREPAGERRGRLERFEFASDSLGNSRVVQVYLPYGYESGSEAYPLLIVHQGEQWLERGLMANSLDNLVGASVRPLVVAFIPPISEWWYEAGGTGTERYLAALAEELVPQLAQRYRLSDRPEDRALMGTKGFGLTAAYGALLHPDVFGKAAIQSVALGDLARHAFFELLEQGPRRELHFYVDWNRYEAKSPDAGFDYAADSERLVRALVFRGYQVRGGEALDSHGWGSWRSRIDDLLVSLFPIE